MADHRMVNSPFRWVGGKSRLRKQIIGLLPPHTCYVEPFAGAAWVLLGKPRSPVEVLNDIDQEVTTFFQVVKESPEALIESFEWELVSRAEFERLADLDPRQLTDVQRAHRFYYLIMAGWGGELNYPRFQTSITDGGHGNRLIGALKTLRQRLGPVHDRLRTVIIECLDWRECIDRYDRDGVVMYVDPPYPQNGCNYRHNMRSWDHHRELADRLRNTQCRWIYSSYDTPEIHDLFPECQVIPVQSASGMVTEKNGSGRVMNNEVLVLSAEPASAPASRRAKHAHPRLELEEAPLDAAEE
jgi:DNA adenine methylase